MCSGRYLDLRGNRPGDWGDCIARSFVTCTSSTNVYVMMKSRGMLLEWREERIIQRTG